MSQSRHGRERGWKVGCLECYVLFLAGGGKSEASFVSNHYKLIPIFLVVKVIPQLKLMAPVFLKHIYVSMFSMNEQ